MEHPDEGTIHAWLDRALSAERNLEIERHVGECGVCAASVAEARGFIAASSRILSALDGVPGGVLPVPVAAETGAAPTDDLSALRAKRQAVAGARARRPWWRHPGLAAAAVAAFLAAGSFTVIGLLPSGDDVTVVPPAAPASPETFRAAGVAVDSTLAANVGTRQARAAAPSATRPPVSAPAATQDALTRKKESVAQAADAAPPPATTQVVGAARSDAPTRLNEAKAGPASLLARASVLSDTLMTRRPAEQESRQRGELAATTTPLVGCYAIRLVAVGDRPMSIAAVRLPTHIALDSTRVVEEGRAGAQYLLRDVSPEEERVAGTYSWRPTGEGSRTFEVLIARDNGTQAFAAEVGGIPTATGGPVTPMPAGAPVRLAATRERCR
jgi:hypothetical protein